MQRQSSIDATQDHKPPRLSSARSTERICAADAVNKSKAAAADELFHQSAPQIPVRRLYRKPGLKKNGTDHPQEEDA
jgi:hypothetical protein